MTQEQCKWEIGACSETGYVRTENEDRMSSIRIGTDRLYLVADGMGGHKAGALAAELTIQGLEAGMAELLPDRPVREAITEAFAAANQIVYAQAHGEDAATTGMGATAVMLLTQGSLAYIAHVGDSRAYLYSKGRLRRLTKDHSPVERMVDAGILTPAEARIHPQANVIDRAMGSKQQLEVEIAEPFILEEGDGILLCSDGLSGYVEDDAIEAVLSRSLKVQEAVNKLVQAALKAGGGDNVTVQFIRRSRLSNKISRNGFAVWLESLLQFKVIAAFTLALLAVYGLAGLFKVPSKSGATEPNERSIYDKNSQQSTVNAPQAQGEPEKQLEAVQKEVEFLKTGLESLKQSTDTQIAAINEAVEKLQKEKVSARQKPFTTNHKKSIKSKVKAQAQAQAQAHAQKQTVSLHLTKTKMIPPSKTHQIVP